MQGFIAVADQLSFSRAAEVLYLTQSTLSQQIADLESELGVDLLIRNNRTVMLTPEGAKFLEGARKLMHTAEQFENTVRSSSEVLLAEKDLSIACDGFMVRDVALRKRLTCIGETLRKNNPNIILYYKVLPYLEVIKSVKTDETDLGFIYQNECSLPKNFNFTIAGQDHLVLVLPEGDDIQDIQMSLDNGVLFMVDNDTRILSQVMKILSNLSVAPEIRFFDNWNTILMLVESGDGAAILPSRFVASYGEPRLYQYNLEYPDADLNLYAIWKKSNMNSFIQLLIEKMVTYNT